MFPDLSPRTHGENTQEVDDHEDDSNDENGDGPLEQPPILVESQLRRSTRQRQSSSRYPSSGYVLLTDRGELETSEESTSHEKHKEWYNAMQDEMKSLHENHTFDLVELSKGKRALGNKWVFRLRSGDSPLWYNRRLVVKAFNQKKGINFDEIFSPVVKISSIRVVLGLVVSMDLEIK